MVTTSQVQLFQENARVVPDERDLDIAEKRLAARQNKTAPQIGDFIRFADGAYHRFSHDWGPEHGLQTSAGGSFYLDDGYASFSGGLDPVLPMNEIRATDEIRDGLFWFFHWDIWQGHNGVKVLIPCRVWETSLTSKR